MSPGTMLVVHVPSATYALNLMKNLIDDRLPFVVSSHLDDVNNFARSKLLGPSLTPASSTSNGVLDHNAGNILEAGPVNKIQLPKAHVNVPKKPTRKRKLYFDKEDVLSPEQPPLSVTEEDVSSQLFKTEKLIKEEVLDEDVPCTSNEFDALNNQPTGNNGDLPPKEGVGNDISQSITDVLKNPSVPHPFINKERFPGVVVKAVRGVHHVMLYKFIVVDSDTGNENLMCYSFTFIKALKVGKIYGCLACKNLRKNVSVTVSEDGVFFKNPVSLPHICDPTPYAQESAKRMMYAKVQQLRSDCISSAITPKTVFQEILAEINSDPHLGRQEKKSIIEALGPFEKHRRPIAEAIIKGRRNSEVHVNGICAEQLLGDDSE